MVWLCGNYEGLASCAELITNNGKIAFNLEYLFVGKTLKINKALREFDFLRDTKLLTKT